MNYLRAAVARLSPLLRKAVELLLPVLKPLIKSAAIAYIREEGDIQQPKIKAALAEKGLADFDGLVDKAQAALKARVLNVSIFGLKVPENLRKRLEEGIDIYGDNLQKLVRERVSKDGLAGFDAAYDIAQALLISRIETL